MDTFYPTIDEFGTPDMERSVLGKWVRENDALAVIKTRDARIKNLETTLKRLHDQGRT